MLGFIKNLFPPHQTAVYHNGHSIVIEKGWRRTIPYLDDEEMFSNTYHPAIARTLNVRYVKTTDDDGIKTTYGVLFRGNSITPFTKGGDRVLGLSA